MYKGKAVSYPSIHPWIQQVNIISMYVNWKWIVEKFQIYQNLSTYALRQTKISLIIII